MPNKTFIIRFTLREPKAGIAYEEQEHTNYTDAFESFRLFVEYTSIQLYSRIELSVYDWNKCVSTPIATLDLHA